MGEVSSPLMSFFCDGLFWSYSTLIVFARNVTGSMYRMPIMANVIGLSMNRVILIMMPKMINAVSMNRMYRGQVIFCMFHKSSLKLKAALRFLFLIM